MTIPPLTWADEAPVVEAAVEYAPRHRKPMSGMDADLRDAWMNAMERCELMRPHIAQHLEVAA